MKLFSFISLLFILVSCKKDKIAAKLSGRWELISTSSWQPVPNPPAPGQTLTLSNNTFEFSKHDTLVASGTYQLEKKKVCKDKETVLMLDYGNSGSSVLYFSIHNDALSLSTPPCYYDGVVSTYKRLP